MEDIPSKDHEIMGAQPIPIVISDGDSDNEGNPPVGQQVLREPNLFTVDPPEDSIKFSQNPFYIPEAQPLDNFAMTTEPKLKRSNNEVRILFETPKKSDLQEAKRPAPLSIMKFT